MSNDQEEPLDAYTTWMGIPVSMNIVAGDTLTSLFCTIIGESRDTVRVRIADQWDLDIYKEMVLAVGSFPPAGLDLSPQDPGEFHQTA